MDYHQIILNLLNLSGAQLWLLIAVLVFIVCAILTVLTFRQFNRHQSTFREDDLPAKPEAVLIDTSHCTNISRYTISEKPVMIGRTETSDSEIYDSIVIPEVTVGRRHAAIEYEDGAFWIEDQGSVNGSYVNGHRVIDRHRLRDGDYIKIHKFTFQFVERFVFAHERSENHKDTDITLPDISPSFGPELSISPNDVLADHGRNRDDLLEIPLYKRQAETDHQRTQVLYRNELEKDYADIKNNNNEKSDLEIRRNIQNMTVQLFKSPDDDKTLRLYSDLLDGPPEQQPDYGDTEKSVLSPLPQVPDMDEKIVADALGDFFNDTQDDLVYPTHLELTEKGDKLAQVGHFSTIPPVHIPSHDKSRKE